MKNSLPPFICVLMCLLPTLMAAQALQEQNPKFRSPILYGDTYLPTRQMTDDPLLRLSRTGPMGEEGMLLELTQLPLLESGPAIAMKFIDPQVPYSGILSMIPNPGGPELRLMALDDPTHDILMMDLGDPVVTPYRPSIVLRKPLVGGAQSAIILGPSENYPKLTLMNTSPSSISILADNEPALNTEFELKVDLESAKETHSFRELTMDLQVERTYDKATPKLLERISSGNSGFSSFFDVFYDLNFATIGMGFGQSANNICYTHHFDPNQPSILSKIESSNPLYLNSFFDITYDLDLGSISTKHHGFEYMVQYNESDWDFISRITSESPLVPGFFDITYDLDLGIHKTQYRDLHYTVISSEPSQICWKFASDFPGTPDFFDICYDLEAHEIKTEMVAMNLVGIFDPASVQHRTTLTSDMPTTPGFMEVAMDISNQDLLVHSTRAGVSGLPSMEMKYEYDGLSRLIREVTVDESSGVTLSLERRLSPSGSALSVGGRLFVEGPVSSESGPLLIIDDAQLNGFLTINGGLLVTGSKMFRIDHPLDPGNKYLQHSCVESPDMMNVYNGNIVTDEKGYATILLPTYFEALNSDFRYQLTCMGQFAQAIVADKIEGNQFTIQTDKPHVEVSWQVTGIRKDPAALNSGYAVEVMK